MNQDTDDMGYKGDAAEYQAWMLHLIEYALKVNDESLLPCDMLKHSLDRAMLKA